MNSSDGGVYCDAGRMNIESLHQTDITYGDVFVRFLSPLNVTVLKVRIIYFAAIVETNETAVSEVA